MPATISTIRSESASTIHSAIEVTHASNQKRMLGRSVIGAELPGGAAVSNHSR